MSPSGLQAYIFSFTHVQFEKRTRFVYIVDLEGGGMSPSGLQAYVASLSFSLPMSNLKKNRFVYIIDQTYLYSFLCSLDLSHPAAPTGPADLCPDEHRVQDGQPSSGLVGCETHGDFVPQEVQTRHCDLQGPLAIAYICIS